MEELVWLVQEETKYKLCTQITFSVIWGFELVPDCMYDKVLVLLENKVLEVTRFLSPSQSGLDLEL